MQNKTSDNEYIFCPNAGSKTDDENINNEYYTSVGLQDFLDDNNNPRLSEDNDNTLAKKIFTDPSKPRYLIKIDTSGKFYDPYNNLAKDYASKDNFLNQTCRQAKFRPVSNSVFGMYVNFLKTKQLSWLYNANRGAE